MTFDQFRKKVQKKVEELAAGKIFQSQEEKIQFFKIARIVCLVFWFLSLLRLLSTSEAVAPLVVFSVLFILIDVFQPKKRPK